MKFLTANCLFRFNTFIVSKERYKIQKTKPKRLKLKVVTFQPYLSIPCLPVLLQSIINCSLLQLNLCANLSEMFQQKPTYSLLLNFTPKCNATFKKIQIQPIRSGKHISLNSYLSASDSILKNHHRIGLLAATARSFAPLPIFN